MEFIKALNQTFATGKTQSLTWRREQLTALKNLLEENEQAIYQALEQDLSKCTFEAYMAEYAFVLSDINLFIKKLTQWAKPRRMATPLLALPGSSKLRPEPLGLVLIIGAWNYPIQLTLSPMIAAIAAGNTVVLKPSELAEKTSNLLAQLIPQYLDNSAIAVYEGGVDNTTALLKQRFDHIFYTGGKNVGKIVLRAASEHLTPVTLELGGKSPCIVDDDCDLKVTADRIIWGKFLNAGQTCVAPDYILVSRKQREPLILALQQALIKQYGPQPQLSDDYGRIINTQHVERLISYLDGQGDNIVCGGQSEIAEKYIAPTLVLNPALDSPIMQNEIFGPLLPIIEVENMQAAIAFIKAREKPLALYLFSKNRQLIKELSEKTSAGTLCVNDAVIFMINHHQPFGGVGESGLGAYHCQ
ncbi:MAG: aldehyde dehydrogenase family protein, partial [Pseudomonadales bacterium]|nr:aldehyde dehydrogenase family protein [Pseudomonadales bacterium]